MNVYPDEIAKVICKRVGYEELIPECEDAIYHLKCIAENNYNSDFYRTFYKVLCLLAEREENA